MTDETRKETIHVEGRHLVEEVKRLVHEGNVRRIVIKHEDHTVVEFPLTVGVVGAVLAAPVAAAGALAALLSDCSIEVERDTDAPIGSDLIHSA